MPILASPEPNSPVLAVPPSPADPNGGDMEPVTSPSASPVAPVDRCCEACGYTPITEVDKETQTDPLVFPYENQLVVLPPFVYPRGTKWWLK